MEKLWILFDGRYRTDEDRAVCYEVCETLKEAKENAGDYGDDTVIVECIKQGNKLHNQKLLTNEKTNYKITNYRVHFCVLFIIFTLFV